MTNENYTQMTNQELVQIIENFNICKSNIERFLKSRHYHLYDEVIKRTRFLDIENKTRISLTQRIYCLRYNLSEIPKCIRCGCSNNVKWNKSLGKFNQHCSCKCSSLDLTVQNKTSQTNLSRLGVKRPLQSKKCLLKAIQTNLQRRGVKYPAQSNEVMNKIRQHNVDTFGAEYIFQTKYFKEKSKSTNLEKRGVEYASQSPDVKKKILQSQTRIYGGIGFASKELAEKVKCKVMEHLHVDHPMRSEKVKNKARNTCRKNCGYDYYQQSPEFHSVSRKFYVNPKYPDMKFATSWEFIVYDFLTEHNISFEYQPSISIPYEYDGKQHTYHPDFRVGDRIVEVKGDHFFRINESTGQEEMYCPYRYPEWSDEKYAHICGIYEAKHQCMLKNNVIILRENDIRNLQYDNFMRTLHSDNNMV